MTSPTPSRHAPSRLRRRFDQTWEPRIGPEASARLARLGLLALLLGPVVMALSVIASMGIGSGRPPMVVVGLGAVLAVVGLCVGWVRLSGDFAASVSRYFGEDIGWRELPRFRASLFDQWVCKRGLRPVARS